MDNLIEMFTSCNITSENWKNKVTNDIQQLAHKYHNELYESICFVPYESMNIQDKNTLCNYLHTNNHAHELLVNQIKLLYPNDVINLYDVDSIIDYYIYSIRLN